MADFPVSRLVPQCLNRTDYLFVFAARLSREICFP
jgi:hypothetical protein